MKRFAVLGAVAALAMTVPAAQAATAKRSTFGRMPDGRAIPAVTLANARGVSVNIIARRISKRVSARTGRGSTAGSARMMASARRDEGIASIRKSQDRARLGRASGAGRAKCGALGCVFFTPSGCSVA